MKLILILSMFMVKSCYGQIDSMWISSEPTRGFIYCEGISWTENTKQDSILKIIIDGDTMTAIRNLLTYCMQEKNENDHAGNLLRFLNLNEVGKIVNLKAFNWELREYRKELAKNKKQRAVIDKKHKINR